MGRLITLPADARVSGSTMYAPTTNGLKLGQILWTLTNRTQTRIAGGAISVRSIGLEVLPEGENALVIGENDAAFQPGDGQPGEGVDENGRPVPQPR